MKKAVFYLVCCVTLTFSECTKEKMLTPLEETANVEQDTVLAQGSFTSNAHPTTGTVKITSGNNTRTLSFKNFNTDNGPDLRVYLAKTPDNSDFIEIGNLKAVKGDFNYVMSSPVNIKDYKYVLIWCEDVSVLFGNAELK